MNFQAIQSFSLNYAFTKEQHNKNKLIYGENKIKVTLAFLWQICTNELLNPFYFLQIVSIIFWYYQGYAIYTSVVISLTIASTGSSIIDMLDVIQTLRRDNEFLEPVYAAYSPDSDHKEERYMTELIDSGSTVPGMLIRIVKPQRVSSDCILISGRCFVSETSVTGESGQKLKRPLPVGTDDKEVYDIMRHREHTIYGGSVIKSVSEPIELLVVNTGFNTIQGQLIKNMLYPQKDKMVQYGDALLFALFLAGLSFIGFCVCLPTFMSKEFSLRILIENLFDLFSVAVPPILPVVMSIGTSLSIQRLRRNWVYCVSPAKVAVAGKTSLVCIDSRGGLVEEDMAFVGYRIVRIPVKTDNSEGFLPMFGRYNNRVETISTYFMLNDIEVDENKKRKVRFTHILATCHLLTLNKDAIVGTREDSEMFASTGASLVFEENNPLIVDNEIIIKMNGGQTECRQIKRNFNEKRRILSVVVNYYDNEYWAYARAGSKGLNEICKSEGIPNYWKEMFCSYEKEGQVVFGMCAKKLDSLDAANGRWEEILCDMDLVGIVVLQLTLKRNAKEMIASLKEARIPCQLYCSETPNVAVAIAKMAGLIDEHEAIVFGKPASLVKEDQPLGVEWIKIEAPDESDKQQLLELEDIKVTPELNLIKDEQIMTNEVKNAALVYDQEATAHILTLGSDPRCLNLLRQTRIFAGMNCGTGTLDIISKLSRGGDTVLMVGSPFSEYGALSKSDVGVLLSVTKQLCVFASFTCAHNDPAGIPLIIAEGKAALLTSYECFKWMAISSIIQFTTTTILYYYSLTLSDEQYLYIDLMLVLPLAFTMSYSEPSGILTSERPSSSLLGLQALASVAGQMVIQMIAQIIMFSLLSSDPDSCLVSGNFIDSRFDCVETSV